MRRPHRGNRPNPKNRKDRPRRPFELVEIRGVGPLTFSMPSCNGARTAEDRARQSRILADCLICSYSMNPTSRTVCTMFVLNPRRTHGGEIVSGTAARIRRGKSADDRAGGCLLKFTVARHRLTCASYDIAVEVVFADRANQHAPLVAEPCKKVAAFHANSITPERQEDVGISPFATMTSMPLRRSRSISCNSESVSPSVR